MPRAPFVLRASIEEPGHRAPSQTFRVCLHYDFGGHSISEKSFWTSPLPTSCVKIR
jgi:hypothetical protein